MGDGPLLHDWARGPSCMFNGGWRVDIRALEAFCRTCETGSFSRACEGVFISRQALSRTIQTLEREVGSPLFVRCTGGVQPTELAHMIEPHARRILDEYEAIKADIRRYEQGLTGTLTLAIEPNAVMTLPTGVLGAYRSARPGISLNLVTTSGSSALESLTSGEVDGVVSIPMYDDAFEYACVIREPLCIVIHAEQLGATQANPSDDRVSRSAINQLNGKVLCGVAREHPIEAQICDYLARHGVFVTMCYDYPSAMLALEAARAGLGGCIMTAAAASSFTVESGLVAVRLDMPDAGESDLAGPPQWEVGVTYRRDSSKEPMIADLVAYLRSASHAEGI